MITVVTVTGIRPDFIRMSEVFKRLDADSTIQHVMIHTGQHFDEMLSDVFFNELQLREPDYNLRIGGGGKEHFHQNAEISVKLIELLRKEKISPDIILFLGDSNSVAVSVDLKKEGYRIGHIEAGMRSGDKRMLEEINRTVCDHCSDFLFVYHEDYRKNLLREGIYDGIHVVGNTIVEVCRPFVSDILKRKRNPKHILVDIHRPENFKYPERMENILNLIRGLSQRLNFPVKWLNFPRTMEYIERFRLDLRDIEIVPLMSYKEYLKSVFDSFCVVSDSGTAQEETALLGVPTVVPRDFTERPQSVSNNCSIMVDVNRYPEWSIVSHWLVGVDEGSIDMDTSWLGDGKTSLRIVAILVAILKGGLLC